MIWVKKDCYGNEQVWYSQDTIKRMQAAFVKILEVSCEETKTWVRNPTIEQIANIAAKALKESEEE